MAKAEVTAEFIWKQSISDNDSALDKAAIRSQKERLKKTFAQSLKEGDVDEATWKKWLELRRAEFELITLPEFLEGMKTESPSS